MGDITHFPFGASSFGMPLIGGGIPIMGGSDSSNGPAKSYFVDPANGSDSNDGLSPDAALDTVSAAYAKTNDKSGDTVYLLNDGNTSGTSREDSTITWSNDNVHLIGLCAPTMVSQRARISPTTGGSSIITPQLIVSGNGNMFQNISLFEGTLENTVASECVRVTGDRNYFKNVAMMNMGETTASDAGDEADSCHLKIDGGEENTFERCYIGLDTIARSTTNANVELINAAARNFFYSCWFPMLTDASTPMFVKIDASGDIDRFVYFHDCFFHNAVGSTSTIAAQAFAIHASAGGNVILDKCSFLGITKLETTASTNLYLNNPIPDAADPTGAEMVVASG